jgi:two-component system, NarL family, nitrate/nitrite response regulator NarL
MARSGTDAIRILLIDEHPITRVGLELIINQSSIGMLVVGSTGCVAEAVELIGQEGPDVILIELSRKLADGFVAIEELASKSPANILIFTNVLDKDLHRQAVLAGARGVVEKTSQPNVVLTAIQKVAEGQIWLDRETLGKIFSERALNKNKPVVSPEMLKISSLTQRERQIVCATASADMSIKAIALALNLSKHTLRNHLTSIYNKLSVGSRLELFALVQRVGLNKFSA